MEPRHPPVSRSSRRLLGVLFGVALAVLLLATATVFPDRRGDGRSPGEPVRARIQGARVVPCPDTAVEAGIECLRVEATLDGGRRVALRPIPLQEVEVGEVEAGRRVVLRRIGAGDLVAYELGSPDRRGALAVGAVVVALLLLVTLRWQGLRAVAVLAGVALLTFGFGVPALDAGADAAVVSAATGGWVVLLVALGRRGATARHVTAAVAAVATVGVGTVGADLLARAAAVSGFAPGGSDAVRVLVLGLGVGAAAAATALALRLVDHTWQLRDTAPDAGWWAIARAGLGRGREDAAGLGIVLLVAFVGARLPALTLLAGPEPLGDVFVSDVAAEMVRLLAALGLLLSTVPVAAGLAAAVAVREGRAAPASDPRRFRSRAERDIWD